jgi:hypothetical protein
MRRSEKYPALTDEVARFQAEVRSLAFAAIRAILQLELDRKRAKLPRVKPPAARPRAEPSAAQPRAKAPPAPPSANPPGPSDATVVPEAVTTHEQPPAPPAGGRKRVPWTRETITSELATWMLSGTTIDATFMTRHGPPGLVAATRRVFGRFDAALNVAALHVSKLYPDGPPER